MATPKKKLSAEERKKIQKQIEDLQAALAEQEEATGAEAQAEADEEVEEQRERLATLFDKLGISEEDYDLLTEAFATGTEERTRKIVREELAAEEEAAHEEGGLGELKGNPEAPPVTPDAPPQEPPKSKHWTEKRLFGKKDEPEEEK